MYKTNTIQAPHCTQIYSNECTKRTRLQILSLAKSMCQLPNHPIFIPIPGQEILMLVLWTVVISIILLNKNHFYEYCETSTKGGMYHIIEKRQQGLSGGDLRILGWQECHGGSAHSTCIHTPLDLQAQQQGGASFLTRFHLQFLLKICKSHSCP
jgi:hypothetical protein